MTLTPSYIELSAFWDAPISAFKDVKSNLPYPTTLRKWLMACKHPNEQQRQYAEICQRLRNTSDDAVGKSLKLSLPAVTVGAELLTRNRRVSDKDKVKAVTGFTQLDIDPADNPHIKDAASLRDAVARIAFVAFAGLSSRGQGVWALVKLANPDCINTHFQQLIRDFAARGIKLDTSKGKRFTDLRLYSYDPDAIIKERFAIYDRVYTALPKIPKLSAHLFKPTSPTSESIFKGALTFAQNRVSGPFQKGNRHEFIRRLCIYLCKHGVPQSEAESFINANLLPLSEIKSNCITSAYRDCANDFGAWQMDTNTNYSTATLPTVKISTVKSVAPIALISNSESSPPLQVLDAINIPEPWEINPF